MAAGDGQRRLASPLHRNHRHEGCRYPKIVRVELVRRHDADAIFQAFPTFTAAVLLVKLAGSPERASAPGGVGLFIGLAMLIQTLTVTLLGSRFPHVLRNVYEPLFYDATISFSDKIARWRVQPVASLQLLTTVMMLSLLAVAVVTRG